MKNITAIAIAILIAFGMLGSQAQASYLGGNSHVQLKHIMVPVMKKKGGFMTTIRPMTPVMTVPKADDVAFVCQRAPRAAEAILYYFQKNPAPVLSNRRVDTKTLDKDFAKIAAFVNRALGRNVVSEVFVVEGGGPNMAKGAASRLPFASIQGCSRVLQEYEQRMKEVLGETKKK